MKSFRIKSIVSLLLAIMMLVSVCTVGIVSSTAAETDIATTGVTMTGGEVLYFKPNSNWKADNARFAAYFYGTGTGDAWASATAVSGEIDLYTVTVPAGSWTNLIWVRMNPSSTTNDWNGKWNQTGNLVYDGTKNLFTVPSGAWDGSTTGWSTYTPPEVVDPSGDKKTIYFLDGTSNSYITEQDSNMFVYTNVGDKIKMTETIDTISGKALWSAKIDAAATYVTFYRASYFYDEDNASTTQWGTWSAGKPTEEVYKATASGAGSWKDISTINAADPEDIENFWDDLWIAPVDYNDVNHAIKVYYNGSTFDLFVPSYVDLSNVYVYSDHESVTIGSQTITSGSIANLTVGKGKTFQFKDGSTTTSKPNLNIYQTTGTATMMMTTKEELCTTTTAGLAKSNAWPSGSGISDTNYNNVYKDAIETKGSYYFYDEEGSQVNSDTVLKKIKGRGNSSFEASMEIYGKYAYNFNLDKKVSLVDGSTASKKWCLMANNVDHAMLRNTLIYSIADDIGLKYSPETRLADVYDNGKYLGAYIVAEKVEYGSNTLMNDLESLDDGNEEANTVKENDPETGKEEEVYVFDEYAELVTAKSNVTVNGQNYSYQYSKSSDETNYPYNTPENFKEYNFLLEFELFSRYEAEASWFVSPRTGQAVVVKYPEFATKDEMEWIIGEYEKAESAVYSDNYEAINNAIDVDSFVKMYLLQELSINLDSGATSYYIHNDLESGKLVSSPVWDFDWALGSYAGTTKYIYNGSSVVNSGNMSNPEQMFVKDKALKTDSNDNTKKNNYNFQAKLVHNATVWERCKYIWTNDVVPALDDYIDNDYADPENKADDGVTEGKLLKEWLPAFTSAVDMNNARWGVYNAAADGWGTKVTSNYNNRSFNFYVGDTSKSGTATKSYANTVYYLNDWVVKRWNYMSSETGGKLYDPDLKVTYKVEDVTFTANQSADESELTVTPSATVTCGDETVEADKIEYTVYLNDKAVGTYAYSTPATITLTEGLKNEVYIVVYPVDKPEINGQSAPQIFKYGYIAPEIQFEVMFKSSNSYRYVPSVSVNGGEAVAMTKTGSAIAKNATGTQQYYWYTATITVKEGESAQLLFTNQYSMRANITISEVEADKEYYFGVDNLNNGTTAVDLTGADEYIKNFVKSATHMVYNDATDAGVATTSIDGTIYKMGDSDGDNVVTILDATTIQYALVEKTTLTETGADLADFDLDGINSVMDATHIQVYLAQ